MPSYKEVHEANRQKFLLFCQNDAREIDPINFNYYLFVRQLAADGCPPHMIFTDYQLGGAYIKLKRENLIKLKVEPPAPKRGSRDQRLFESGQIQTMRGYSPLEQNRDEEAAAERRKVAQTEASKKQAVKDREKSLARIENHKSWANSNRISYAKTETDKAAMRAELEATGKVNWDKWEPW
jgi:hypothetical protein